MQRKKRLLAITYGGGHVLMLLPVLRSLRNSGLEIQVMGLTTAFAPLSDAGFEPISFRSLVRKGDEIALARGEILARDMHTDGKTSSFEESVAYLGLSYADLERRVGEAEAQRLFESQGRQCFLPLGPVGRAFDLYEPDVFLTTNSPRAELAGSMIARSRSIPSLRVIDLFGIQRWDDSPADVLALNCIAAEGNLRDKVDPSIKLSVTGNPNMDRIAGLVGQDAIGASWRAAHGIGNNTTLVLFAMHPLRTKTDSMILDTLYECTRADPDFRVILRPHPRQAAQEIAAEFTRFGYQALQGAGAALDDLILASDAVVTSESTVGVEAALLGRRVVVFGRASDDPAHQLPLHRYGWAEFASGIEEGKQKLLKSSNRREEARDIGRQTREAWRCDGHSADRISEEILRLAGRG